MGMNEFKLQFYFNLYKDKPLQNRNDFRKKFKKECGEFQYLEELILMIEKYQLKKYGETLNDFVKLRSKEEARYFHNKANAREKRRLK